ncbi:hypothetical protein JCM8547_000108 [Rhodosporidiobolus lusitaniae]
MLSSPSLPSELISLSRKTLKILTIEKDSSIEFTPEDTLSVFSALSPRLRECRSLKDLSILRNLDPPSLVDTDRGFTLGDSMTLHSLICAVPRSVRSLTLPVKATTWSMGDTISDSPLRESSLSWIEFCEIEGRSFVRPIGKEEEEDEEPQEGEWGVWNAQGLFEQFEMNK